MINYYTILGLTNFSSLEEIKKAHRKLSLKYHPDLNNGNKAFEEKFKVVQNAYEHLSTEEKKQSHDEYLRAYLYNQHTTNTYQTYTQQTYQQQQRQQYQQQTYPTQRNERSFRFPWFFVVFIGMSLLRLCNQDSSTNYSYSDVQYQGNNLSYQNSILDSFNQQQNTIETTPAGINKNVTVNNKFSIGSPSSKVIEVQGMPNSTHLADDGKQILYYNNSDVIIEYDVVTGFNNVDNNLKVSLENNTGKLKDNTALKFSIGSSKDDVLTLQGMPSSVKKNDVTNEYEWSYGKSYLMMKNDFVASYVDADNNLKVSK